MTNVWLTRRSLIGSDLVIVTVSIFHIFEAWVVWFTTAADGSIGVAALLSAFGHNRWVLSTILCVAAVLAIGGRWVSGLSMPIRIIALLPQLTLLLITSSAAVQAIFDGSYADGVLRSWAFIACDQTPRVIIPILYAIATCARIRAT